MKTEPDRFFSIRNWKRFQHYKERNPPWIRLYRDLLRDRGYQTLSDTTRSHLVGLFLVAAYTDNHIPDDQRWLRHELCTKSAIDLKALAASGWITYDTEHASTALAEAEMLASCQQDATSETETDNSEAEVQRQIPAYGEFASVRLTPEQHEKLKGRLNGNLETYIDRLDRYSQTHPSAFRKYKSHYATILTWFDRDVKDGKTPRPPVVAERRPTGVHFCRFCDPGHEWKSTDPLDGASFELACPAFIAGLPS